MYVERGEEEVYLVMLESDLESEQDLDRLYGESCLQSLPLDFHRMSCSQQLVRRYFDILIVDFIISFMTCQVYVSAANSRKTYKAFIDICSSN